MKKSFAALSFINNETLRRELVRWFVVDYRRHQLRWYENREKIPAALDDAFDAFFERVKEARMERMKKITGMGRGVLQRPRGEQIFEVTRFAPSSTISDVIAYFWTVRWDLRDQEPYTQQNLPGPAITLSFERPQSQVWGPAQGRFVKVLAGKGHVFAAKFLPGGLRRFWPGQVSSLREQRFPVDTIFPKMPRDILDALVDEETPQDPTDYGATQSARDSAAARVFDRTMCDLARYPVDSQELSLVQRLSHAMIVDRTIQSVSAAARSAGLSQRSLQRLFHNYVGYSPKWILQRGRLQDAAELLTHEDVKLSDLALELGYADQAHFARALKAQIGQTPTAYLNAARAYADQRAASD